jgi:hypothetical protein
LYVSFVSYQSILNFLGAIPAIRYIFSCPVKKKWNKKGCRCYLG